MRICSRCGHDWTGAHIKRDDGSREEILFCDRCDAELPPPVQTEQRIDGELLSLIRLLTKVLDAGWKLTCCDNMEVHPSHGVHWWAFLKDEQGIIGDGNTDAEALTKAWHWVSLLAQSEPPVRSSKSPQEIANEFGESDSRIIQEPNPKAPKSSQEMADKFGDPSIESSEEWLSAVKYGAIPIPARYAAVILDELACLRAKVAKLRGVNKPTEDSLKIACLRQEVVRLYAESEKLREGASINVEAAVKDATRKIETSRDAWRSEAMASRKELDERFKRITHLGNVCKELREQVSRIAADCSAMDRRCYELANLLGDKDRRISELDQIAKETFARKAQLEEDNKELNKRIYELEAVSSQLTRDMDLIKVRDADGVWYWQGDGNDHPESITCPVVMSADILRTILAERTWLKAEGDRLRILISNTVEKSCGSRGCGDEQATCISRDDPKERWCRYCLSTLASALKTDKYSRISELDGDKQELYKRITELEEMLHNERDTMGAEQIRLSDELKNADERIARLRSEHESYIALKHKRILELEGSLTNAINLQETWRDEVCSLRAQNKGKDDRISELEDGNNRISKCWIEETEALKLEIGSLRRERDQLKAEVERLRALLAPTLSDDATKKETNER